MHISIHFIYMCTGILRVTLVVTIGLSMAEELPKHQLDA